MHSGAESYFTDRECEVRIALYYGCDEVADFSLSFPVQVVHHALKFDRRLHQNIHWAPLFQTIRGGQRDFIQENLGMSVDFYARLFLQNPQCRPGKLADQGIQSTSQKLRLFFCDVYARTFATGNSIETESWVYVEVFDVG